MTQKGIVEYYHILGVPHIYIKECPWQAYINAILGCLQSRKNCKANMDDLLLFAPLKRAHKAKLEGLLKALLNNGLKISTKSVSYLKQNYNIWGITYI